MPTNLTPKTLIYLIDGQGSDSRLFSELTFDSQFEIDYINYGTPEKRVTLKQFSKLLSKKIDTSREFILIGVSMGGMICAELNEIMNPKKVIIISSAKNRNEFPLQYKFQRRIPLYEILPGFVLLFGAKFLQPIVEPDRKSHKSIFKSMLNDKTPLYIKRTIRMIIQWKRISNSKQIYQIHGTNDHTLPIRNLTKADYKIENGSHMMTLTRAREVNEVLNKILLG